MQQLSSAISKSLLIKLENMDRRKFVAFGSQQISWKTWQNTIQKSLFKHLLQEPEKMEKTIFSYFFGN